MVFPYLSYVVASSWVMYLWLTLLDFRQHQKLQEKKRPDAIVAIVDEEKFLKAQEYGSDKSSFAFIRGFISQLETTAILCCNVYPLIWDASVSMMGGWGYGPDYEIMITLGFLGIFMVYSTITTLPFDLYGTFVIEEKHGFNKQTLALFFTDLLKTTVLSVVLGAPVTAMFVWIIKWGGEHFYLYVWAFVFAFQMLAITIYPVFIQPCFNKVDPLPAGPLRQAIEQLAEEIKFPLKKLYQIDGSKRSGHSNAYFYGFCDNKRIVLFDTLIEQQTEEEVVAVLGHELGHWKMMHMPKMIVIIQIRLLVQFFAFGMVIHNMDMYTAFGLQSKSVIVGFMLFNHLISPVDFLLDFFNTIITRIHEFQADHFAVKLGKAEDLKSGLIKLQIENLGNMNPDKWYSTWHYSHPPMVERLQAIDQRAAEEGKKAK